MKGVIGACRKIRWIFAFGILMGGIALGSAVITARAQENAFSVNAEILPSDKITYDIRVTVENEGEDWEGTVRVQVDEGSRQPCAYDTAITLPKGSTKQFVVKVPVDNLTYSGTDGTVYVTLLDGKNQKTAEQEFKKLLMQEAEALSLGILSDDYPALTYLDMGGQKEYYYGSEYPIRLMELNQGNLMDTLASLDFMVIDQYHTDVLTDEEVSALVQWIDDGGVLIIGTGSYAADTLAAFENLGVKCRAVLAPEENTYYSPGSYSDVDLTQLTLAELALADSQYSDDSYSDDSYSGAFACSMGDGAVGILPYSLTELGRMGEDFFQETGQEWFVQSIYDAVSIKATARFRYAGALSDYDYQGIMQKIMNMLSSSDNVLNFALLKWIVFLYVIFVGPVLYLILKLMKKRELYWVAVPVSALAGILLISFAGRGFEVVSTKVYSVAVENLSDRGNRITYLLCYDANHREWDLRLAEDYEYAGPLINDKYSYEDDGSYYHHIKKEGDRLYFGVNPSSNFEDSYFCAGSSIDEQTADSRIVGENISVDWTGPVGEITNETEWDFRYFAICAEDMLYVYENLPAGESCSLAGRELVYADSQGSDLARTYTYNAVRDAYEDKEMEKAGELAALGMGICTVYSRMSSGEVAVVGMVEDWEKAVDDNCSEVSYGCLYAVQ